MSKQAKDFSREMKILAVDDEKSTIKLYTSLLKEEGYSIVTAITGKEALAKIESEEFDLVLLDLKLPDMDGTDIMERIKQKNLDLSVIIVTANPSMESSIQAVKAGVYDYIVKPFASEDLKLVIRRAVEKARLLIENKKLMGKLDKANKVLIERVEQLEKFAKIAVGYEGEITNLKEKLKKIEKKQKPDKKKAKD